MSSTTSLRLLAEPMEARILYSADVSPLAWAGAAGMHIEAPTIETTAVNVQATEIAFVDAALPDANELIDDLHSQRRAGRDIEIVRIDAGVDGLGLISDTLAGRDGIAAVHVLAHGSEGRLQLGAAVLDAQTLVQRADEVAAWGGAMTLNADLLLYGCDLARNDGGQRLVRDLSLLTGTDVVASTNLTGATARGGDWTLEYGIGSIETTLAPSSAAQMRWQGLLTTYAVTTTADGSGVGSLRWAITQANANAGTDTIVFGVNGSFNIAAGSSGDDNNSVGDFDIRDSVSIVGNGSASTVVNGNGVDRVFDLRSGTVSLSGLTIQGGESNRGAGIRVDNSASVTLTDVVVQNNDGDGSTKGAGIANDGVLTLRRVIVQNNGTAGSADIEGAGIYNDKDAVLDALDVEIRGNVAAGDKDGGGLYIDANGSVLLRNVTLAANLAGRGGGIFTHSENTSLVNVTIAGNTGRFEGGGLWSDGGATLNHVSVVGNASPSGLGGGIYGSADSVSARNSLFAANNGGNTSAALTSEGYNLSDDSSAGFGSTGDRRNVVAGVSTIQDNGGFARTVAIAADSAARDAANPSSSRTVDQRGVSTYGTRADIGAYEYSPGNVAPTLSALPNQSIDEDQSMAAVAFTVSDVETNAASLVVTATSSNGALVRSADIVLGGAGTSRTLGLAPVAHANGAANGGTTTITVTVSDGSNTTSTGFLVTVNATNDAPGISWPSPPSVDEDAVLVLTGANAPQISDIDAGNAAVQVTLMVANGTLSLSQTTGLAFITGTGSNNANMTFNGSQAAVNSALAGLQYRPRSQYNGTDRLELTVNDLGNTGGAARSTTGSLDITVNARNDAPLLGLPGPQATPLVMPLLFSASSGNAITVSDVDAGNAPVRLALDVVNGTITLGSLTGVTLIEGTGTADGRVVLSGSVSDLHAALEGSTFTAALVGPARIDLVLDDLGNSGAGAPTPASGSVAITVGDDALPVLSLGTPTAVFAEGGAPTVVDPGLTVTDADHLTLASAQVIISQGYRVDDVLAFANDGTSMGNIVGSYGSGVLSLVSAGQTATLAEWEVALRAVTYASLAASPDTAPRTISLTVNDGIADSALRQIALSVIAVNDAPVLTGANNLMQTAEDATNGTGTLVSTLLAGHLTDADDGASAGIAVVAVDDRQGVWQYTVDGGANWLAFGPVTESAARLLAADANTAVRILPAADWSGTVADGLRFRAWDRTDPGVGGTADTTSNGGASAFSSATFGAGATVVPVNDAPVGGVSLSGSARQGQTLTAVHTLSDADGPAMLSVDYRWYADGVEIVGAAGGSLLLDPSHVGKAISVVARYTDAFGTVESVASPSTSAVANVNDVPSGAVVITGTAMQGRTLTAGHTLADADGPATLAVGYQWYADGIALSGATGTTLQLDQAHVGKAITVVARYSDAFAVDESVLSAPTAAVTNVNDAPVLVRLLSDQSAPAGAALRFALPSNTFADPDSGDALVFSASLADGSPLPAWIRFDALNQVFTVTPTGIDAGPVPVRVIASDLSGASAQALFAFIVVAPPLDPSAPPASPLPPAAEAPAPAPVLAAPSPRQPAVTAPTRSLLEEAPAAAPSSEAAPAESAAPAATVVAAGPAGDRLRTGEFAVRPEPDGLSARPQPLASATEPASGRPVSRADAVLGPALVAQYTNLASMPLTQLLQSEDLLRTLDQLQRQLSEVGEEHRGVIASSVAMTTGLSIGYVVWLVRGGVLMSSMLSALPAWQMIDPMPVLAAGGALKGRRAVEPPDEPEVERLFGGAVGDPASAPHSEERTASPDVAAEAGVRGPRRIGQAT